MGVCHHLLMQSLGYYSLIGYMIQLSWHNL